MRLIFIFYKFLTKFWSDAPNKEQLLFVSFFCYMYFSSFVELEKGEKKFIKLNIVFIVLEKEKKVNSGMIG